MIETFSCEETKKIFNGLNSKRFGNIQKIAKRKLDMLHFSHKEQDLLVPPANHFEHLQGNLKDFCSIRVNDQFRIIFKFENGNAYDAKIIDYHK